MNAAIASPATGIVLAAGSSRRAGCAKALLTMGGEALVARAVRVLREGGCASVLVVVGPPHEDPIRAATPSARHVRNADPTCGMLSSLQIALREIQHGPAVVALVDHPHVGSATVGALLSEWHRTGASAVRPRHAGRCGHPYVISGGLLDEIRTLAPDADLRAVLRSAPQAVILDVDDRYVLEDLDTPEEIARI